MTCCKWFGQLWRQNYQPLRRPGSFLHRRSFAGIISVPSQETLFTFLRLNQNDFTQKKKSGVTVHVSLVSTCSSWSVETFLGFMSRHSDDLSCLSMIGFIRTVFYSILLCELFLLVFLSELSHQQTCRFSWFFFFLCSLFKCKTVVTLFDPKSSCQVVCFCFFSIIRPQFFHTL